MNGHPVCCDRKAAPDVSWLPIDINFLGQLWLPNVYVYDLVSFNPLECLEKLAGLWVVEKKEIFYNLVGEADVLWFPMILTSSNAFISVSDE